MDYDDFLGMVTKLEAQLAECQRWASAWKRLARRWKEKSHDYWDKYCDQFEQTKEVKLQREAAVETLSAMDCLFIEHRKKSFITCPEQCFCWDYEAELACE